MQRLQQWIQRRLLAAPGLGKSGRTCCSFLAGSAVTWAFRTLLSLRTAQWRNGGRERRRADGDAELLLVYHARHTVCNGADCIITNGFAPRRVVPTLLLTRPPLIAELPNLQVRTWELGSQCAVNRYGCCFLPSLVQGAGLLAGVGTLSGAVSMLQRIRAQSSVSGHGGAGSCARLGGRNTSEVLLRAGLQQVS